MPANKIEILNMNCPEKHGSAEITLDIFEHSSGKKFVTGQACNRQRELLKINKNCNWVCANTEKFQQLKKAIEQI